MAEKRMRCWQCPRYSRAERRCRDSKANPKSKADSVAVAEQLGLRALCHYNPYRDALALRMHFPARAMPPVVTPLERLFRRRNARSEVEIETNSE
jgi:hypothetical protein